MKSADQAFFQKTLTIALPVGLQSLIQSSFSAVDQIMIGQLGETAVAGIGFGARYISLALTVITACATAAGIFAAQYEGQNNRKQLAKSASDIFWISLVCALIFLVVDLFFPHQVLGFYTPELPVQREGVLYLRIYIWSLLFSVINAMVSVLLRTCGYPKIPLYISAAGILVNTTLNALLIFAFHLGVMGAALASLISMGLMGFLNIFYLRQKLAWFHLDNPNRTLFSKNIWIVLGPLLATEFFWGLGETIYGAVYGRLGTAASAAMTMTVPLQSMIIGMLSGLSQAAGILIGQRLGAGEMKSAFHDSKLLSVYSLIGSVILSLVLILAAPWYVSLYSVSAEVKELCIHLLIAFALFSIVKVQNMVVAGGILRSGGKTALVLGIDLFGTWCLGVPLALFALHQGYSIVGVYYILSLEEVARLVITLIIFFKKSWMQILPAKSETN